jgi:hypothetical protein
VPTGTFSTTSFAAALGLEMLPVAEVDQRVEAVHRLDHHIAALAAVAARGAAELDEFLTPERDAAVAAGAGLHINLGFVEEFHGRDIAYRGTNCTRCFAITKVR